jgi:hypothetical protein
LCGSGNGLVGVLKLLGYLVKVEGLLYGKACTYLKVTKNWVGNWVHVWFGNRGRYVRGGNFDEVVGIWIGIMY